MSDDIWRSENGLRYDPLDDAWTLIARNRRTVAPRSRPRTVDGPAPASEFVVEAALARLPQLGTHTVGTQTVRAIPSPTPLAFVEFSGASAAAFTEIPALGAHELLAVATAPVDAQAQDLTADAYTALFALFAARARDLGKDTRLTRVGMVLPPPSARRSPLCAASLLALPLPPPTPPPTCAVCAAVTAADAQHRVVLSTDDAIAWVPFAPQHLAHVRVAHRAHTALTDDPTLEACAALGECTAAAAKALAHYCEGASLKVEVRPMSLRAPTHFCIDIVATDDVDTEAFGGQRIRVCPQNPEDIAAALRALVHEAVAPPRPRMPESGIVSAPGRD